MAPRVEAGPKDSFSKSHLTVYHSTWSTSCLGHGECQYLIGSIFMWGSPFSLSIRQKRCGSLGPSWGPLKVSMLGASKSNRTQTSRDVQTTWDVSKLCREIHLRIFLVDIIVLCKPPEDPRNQRQIPTVTHAATQVSVQSQSTTHNNWQWFF